VALLSPIAVADRASLVGFFRMGTVSDCRSIHETGSQFHYLGIAEAFMRCARWFQVTFLETGRGDCGRQNTTSKEKGKEANQSWGSSDREHQR